MPKTENTTHPRGKIKFRQTALRNLSRSIRHKVYCERYEQIIDVPYNQIIKYALWFLSQRLYRMPSKNRELLRLINGSLLLFDAVTLHASSSLFSKVENDLYQNRIAPNRQYYIAALKIALSLLYRKGISFSGHGKEIELSSYIIDFDVLFESYLRQLLKTRLHAESAMLHVHDGNNEAGKPLFDDRNTPQANPDIVIEAASGNKIIVEVKYKDKVDRDDINQAITYGFSYRAQNVVLAHVSSEAGGSVLKSLGKIDSVNLHSYAFCLNSSVLEDEEKKLAEALLSIISPSEN
jgi:5-methylcytosine-specific restriction enzyme subunit McrC